MILALDIGATNTRMALYDSDLNAFEMKKITTPRKDLLGSLREIVQGHKRGNDITALVISVAGPVKNGAVQFTNIESKPILTESDFIDFVPSVLIINDATAAAYFESKTRNADDLIFLTYSSGIGVGVISAGKIVNFEKTADEPGHSRLDSRYDIPCACGGSNHWESYASGTNMPKFLNEYEKAVKHEITNHTTREIFESADNGDRHLEEFLITELGNVNSCAINKLIHKYGPEIIVVGGPVALYHQHLFLAGLKPNLQDKVVFTTFGDEISLLGAATYLEDNYKIS